MMGLGRPGSCRSAPQHLRARRTSGRSGRPDPRPTSGRPPTPQGQSCPARNPLATLKAQHVS